jgi:hypothetical protein
VNGCDRAATEWPVAVRRTAQEAAQDRCCPSSLCCGSQFEPDAFTHLSTDPFEFRQALTYFSFSTLTTSSFGDILPVHPIACSLANLEAICGRFVSANFAGAGCRAT